MKTYELIKKYHGHKVGELLYQIDDMFYQFKEEPQYRIDKFIVESDTEYFLEYVSGYKANEDIYYIDVFNEVVEDKYNSLKHAKLIKHGNCFKSLQAAINIRNSINNLIIGDSVVFTEDELSKIKHLCINNQNKELIEFINNKKVI